MGPSAGRLRGAGPDRSSHVPGVAGTVALVLIAVGLGGCAYYSFSGASLPARLETIAVPLAEDRTGSRIPGLDDEFTSELTDRFISQTRLSLAGNAQDADVLLESWIANYVNEPTSVTGDQAALNRVTIRVGVRYYDQVQDSLLLEQTFSSFEEYDPALGLDGERQAATAALATLAEDVFTAATSDW